MLYSCTLMATVGVKGLIATPVCTQFEKVAQMDFGTFWERVRLDAKNSESKKSPLRLSFF